MTSSRLQGMRSHPHISVFNVKHLRPDEPPQTALKLALAYSFEWHSLAYPIPARFLPVLINSLPDKNLYGLLVLLSLSFDQRSLGGMESQTRYRKSPRMHSCSILHERILVAFKAKVQAKLLTRGRSLRSWSRRASSAPTTRPNRCWNNYHLTSARSACNLKESLENPVNTWR